MVRNGIFVQAHQRDIKEDICWHNKKFFFSVTVLLLNLLWYIIIFSHLNFPDEKMHGLGSRLQHPEGLPLLFNLKMLRTFLYQLSSDRPLWFALQVLLRLSICVDYSPSHSLLAYRKSFLSLLSNVLPSKPGDDFGRGKVRAVEVTVKDKVRALIYW